MCIYLYLSLFRKVLDERDELYQQLAEYLQLKTVVETLEVSCAIFYTCLLVFYICTSRIHKVLFFSFDFLQKKNLKESGLKSQVDLGCNFYVQAHV